MMLSGGYLNQQQLTKYDIANDSFVDYGSEYLSSSLTNANGEFGRGIYYTQINDTTMFTINSNGYSINVYNLESLAYHKLDTPIPTEVGKVGCISSSENPSPRLYITGGYDSEQGLLDELQIVDLEDMRWISNPPSMKNARSSHGCVVVNEKLWAISGAATDTVEVMDLSSRWRPGKWKETGSLDCALYSFGVIVVEELIFVIGGYCSNMGPYSDRVYTIDTVTYSISVYSYRLPYAVDGMPVMTWNDTIDGFGGWGGSGWLDSWVTLELLTEFIKM